MEAHTARTCRVTHTQTLWEAREGVGSWEQEEENILDIPTCCGAWGGHRRISPPLYREALQTLGGAEPGAPGHPAPVHNLPEGVAAWPLATPMPMSPSWSGSQMAAQGPGRGHGHLVSGSSGLADVLKPTLTRLPRGKGNKTHTCE